MKYPLVQRPPGSHVHSGLRRTRLAVGHELIQNRNRLTSPFFENPIQPIQAKPRSVSRFRFQPPLRKEPNSNKASSIALEKKVPWLINKNTPPGRQVGFRAFAVAHLEHWKKSDSTTPMDDNKPRRHARYRNLAFL